MAYPGIGWASRPANSMAPVVVSGTRWCAASQMVRRHLDRLGIPYHYVDLELGELDRALAEAGILRRGWW